MSGTKLGRFALISLGILSVNAHGQQPASVTGEQSADRPRVGLALSGGAARGGAHVGVLRALEELNVPIDYIAGTSIGAIIGGFYASGMTVDEIETVIDELDWEGAFLEATPREQKSFRRKQDDERFLVKQKPGFNDSEIDLPLGLVQGQTIDLILTENTLHVAAVDDFDALPIPFRAVAADIVTGEAVVLDSGNLARALRASMSIPAVLAPIEINGRLLVDGGVAMNLPVEVARDMGADIIIAVDISSPLSAREELSSVLDVTAQLTTLLTLRSVQEQIAGLESDDLLLTPAIPAELTSTSFNRMGEIIPFGYEVSMLNAEQLRALAIDEEEFLARGRGRAETVDRNLPVVNFLRLENNSRISDAVIERHLRDVELGGPLDLETLEEAIDELFGLDLYQNVRYEVVTENGDTGIELQLDERAWGPRYLQFGLDYSESGDSDALFGFQAGYLSTALNRLGGEWRAILNIGDEPEFFTEFHQPFGAAGEFFVSPAFQLESDRINVFDNGTQVASLQRRQAVLELGVGREFGTWGEIRAGLRSASGDTKLLVGDPAFVPADDFQKGEVFARLSTDTLDSVVFPRDGYLGRVEWVKSRPERLSADADFDQVKLQAVYAKTWSRYTLVSTFRYDATVSGVAPVYSRFELGGLFDLSGLNRDELSGQHAARIGGNFYRRLNDLALLPVFAGVSVEYGDVWDDRSRISLADARVGGSVWVGVDTPIGPLYLAYGRAEAGDGAFYLFLGRIY